MAASARQGDEQAIRRRIPACTNIRSKPRRLRLPQLRRAGLALIRRSSAPVCTANTWHYFFNRNEIKPGSIVVFDFAADLDHMTMDITRTFNIDGKFTSEQAKWYNVDLE